MASKLGRLPPATQSALKQMACLGNVTAAATLDDGPGRDRGELHSALGPAVRADLVLLQGGDYRSCMTASRRPPML